MPDAFRTVRVAEGSAAPRSVVLGVDTHKGVHVAAVLDHLGGLLGTGEFPATAAGYHQLLDWVRKFGTVLRAGVECTGSYGAGLARYLATQRVPVVEVNQPDRSTRRRRGKTDAVDAESAARAVLSGIARALPKSGDGQDRPRRCPVRPPRLPAPRPAGRHVRLGAAPVALAPHSSASWAVDPDQRRGSCGPRTVPLTRRVHAAPVLRGEPRLASAAP